MKTKTKKMNWKLFFLLYGIAIVTVLGPLILSRRNRSQNLFVNRHGKLVAKEQLELEMDKEYH
jgi:uncharacterized Tic20 family protein